MNKKKVYYRIPFGFKDYFKKAENRSLDFKNSVNFRKNIFTTENAKSLAAFISDIMDSYPIALDEKNISDLNELLDLIDKIKFDILESEDKLIICQSGNSIVKVEYLKNKTEFIIYFEVENNNSGDLLDDILTHCDAFFLSLNNLVYKCLYMDDRLYAFSNINDQWCENIQGFIGIDVGSVSTNVIYLDNHDNVMETVYTYTRGRVLDAIKTSFAEIQKKMPFNSEIFGVGVTGSSGELAKVILNADIYRTEIYSHAAATIHQIPDVKTIMEIGGQDSKVIYVKEGIPEKSKMNEWCGAGTGAMLDAQSHRLGIPIDEFGDYALNAKKSIDFRTRCGVFMDSCMIDAQARGYPVETIISGLCKACAKNFINTLGINRKTVGFPISFQGGVASNRGVKNELEKFISEARNEKCELIVPLYHKVMGAIGIALITAKFHRKRNTITNFRGFEDIFRIKSEVIQCDAELCPHDYSGVNLCDIVRLDIDGNLITAIGACDEYHDEIMERKAEEEVEVSNMGKNTIV